MPSTFETLCDSQGIPMPQPEYQFCLGRKWRFDWAWPVERVALEIEGGIWTQGRHNRASGFLKDMEKYNKAACLGWIVLRCTRKQFDKADPAIFEILREALMEV